VHDQIEGDACDIAVVPAGAKEAVTNTRDYRDAPVLAIVFDRGVRYFLQIHDKSAAVRLALQNKMPFLAAFTIAATGCHNHVTAFLNSTVPFPSRIQRSNHGRANAEL
jgi:hypothetical protein